MKITIHQPEHMPWLGLFHKIEQADICVILDNVQFRKNYFQNRNKIRTANGWTWITVPVTFKIDTQIKDVSVAPNQRWKKKWIDSVYFAYKKAPHFDAYFDPLKAVLENDEQSLSRINTSLIRLLCSFLGIHTSFVPASDLDASGKGSDLLLEICKALNASEYLSGISGREYLNVSDFTTSGIHVSFQEFHHPIYTQLHAPFEPCMSAIDLIFNHGKDSLNITKGIGVPIMEEVFL